MFTVFYIHFQTAAEVVRDFGTPFTRIMDAFLTEIDVPVFLAAPVRNWTFDGIEEEILGYINDHPEAAELLNLPVDKFGWFYPVRFVSLPRQ